jgi:putative transposase
MPRKARIDAPGALHHIIVRGIDRNPIFKGSEDYENFLVRLGRILQETSTTCYAWALIPNHVHLLLRTGTTPISSVMRRLLTGYAQYFNRLHNRHGYLFQNRYKSFLCETDPYLLELVRYIHLNPIRANILHDIKTLDTPHNRPCLSHGKDETGMAGYGLYPQPLRAEALIGTEGIPVLRGKRHPPGEKI